MFRVIVRDALAEGVGLWASLLVGLVTIVPMYVLGIVLGMSRETLVLGLFPALLVVLFVSQQIVHSPRTDVGSAGEREVGEDLDLPDEPPTAEAITMLTAEVERLNATLRAQVSMLYNLVEDRNRLVDKLQAEQTASAGGHLYSILIQWSDDDQAYIVSLPEWDRLGDVKGESYQEALRQGLKLLDLLVASARERNEPLPEPRVVRQRR